MQIKKYAHGARSHGVYCRQYRTNGAALHWHEFYELELVLSGEGTHILNGVAYPWERGRMHLLRLSDLHEIRATNSEVCLLQVDAGCMPQPLLAEIAGRQGNLAVALQEEETEEAAFLFRLLQKESNEERRLYLLHLIVGRFLDGLQTEETSVYQGRMGEILTYIGTRFREPLTPASLAETFYLNKSYLCTGFKAYTGKTVVEYVTELRLEYAASLARTTDLNSTQLAEAAGFGSLSHFLRCFKRKFGVSPGGLRKENAGCNRNGS